MGAAAKRSLIPHSHVEQLRAGKDILLQEAEGLTQLAQQLDADFCAALQLLENCTGSVIVTGMGKAGLIGKKIVATLSSTGTRAHFLQPAEAVHGDLGCLHKNDLLLALSNSGETEEICRLIPCVRDFGIPIIAITATRSSQLGRAATSVLELGKLQEAGPFGLAPSTSTTAMLALGDALALVLCSMKGFSPQQFARYHPGGALGAQLKRAEEVMRKPNQLCIASQKETIRNLLRHRETTGRRSGAILLVDDEDCLVGLFTDSDLARLLEQRQESQLDRPICEVMTVNPISVSPDLFLSEVVELLSSKKISELPVVNKQQQPLGLIDITDVIGLDTTAEEEKPTIKISSSTLS